MAASASNDGPTERDSSRKERAPLSAYQLMIKPCGPACNLNCTYCYYLPKQRMFDGSATRMSDLTLEEITRQYISSHGSGTITFAWQGGEPTLAGLDFFRKALELQEKYRPPGMMIENTLQTNGTLLDDRWCRFLHEERFLVGLSADGPPSLHDIYRVDRTGEPTSGKVVQASRLLRRHRVEFNTLTVVDRENARHPLQVYRYLRNVIGSRHMQFIPCVEPKGFERVPPQGRDAKDLPTIGDDAARPGTERSVVTEWSVDPVDYGSFMTMIFDEWLQKDVGRVFVINFEVALASWMGLPPTACSFAEHCGDALVAEHDGSIYSCDHYVYPEHRLGRIQEVELSEMVSSDQQARFGREKARGLPAQCRECEFLFACHGECPRNRFIRNPDGGTGLNYLCPGLRRFFIHVGPWMKLMADGIRAGRTAEDIARAQAPGRERERADRPSGNGRGGMVSGHPRSCRPPEAGVPPPDQGRR
ncbi:MAG: anaerobic sulfatase maturase [Methanomassiliicoccus sp.]|nr:anaerobic sulfatase maturase [Methanomassiliicoccus sp.]